VPADAASSVSRITEAGLVLLQSERHIDHSDEWHQEPDTTNDQGSTPADAASLGLSRNAAAVEVQLQSERHHHHHAGWHGGPGDNSHSDLVLTDASSGLFRIAEADRVHPLSERHINHSDEWHQSDTTNDRGSTWVGASYGFSLIAAAETIRPQSEYPIDHRDEWHGQGNYYRNLGALTNAPSSGLFRIAKANRIHPQSKRRLDHRAGWHGPGNDSPRNMMRAKASSGFSGIAATEQLHPQSKRSGMYQPSNDARELMPAHVAASSVSHIAAAKQIHPAEWHRLNDGARRSTPADASSGISAMSRDKRVHPPSVLHKVRLRRTNEAPADIIPSSSLSPIKVAVTTSNPCFANRDELTLAVDEYMTKNCLNDPNCTLGGVYGWPINSWCASNVTDMSYLFSGSGFNDNISSWDVSNVTNMAGMFQYTYAFAGDISQWDVSNVVNMSYMFYYATSFNGQVSGWGVSQVTNMAYMFANAQVFNGDISGWDVSNLVDMSYMFYYAYAFNGQLMRWNISSVSNMNGMFFYATSFNHNLCSWAETFPYDSATEIFALSNCAFTVDPVSASGGPFCASDCDVGSNPCFANRDKLKLAVGEYMRQNCPNDPNCTLGGVYGWPINSWCVSHVTDMSYLFSGSGMSGFNDNISSWDVSNVTNMAGMFQYTYAFAGDISQWDVSNVVDGNRLFAESHFAVLWPIFSILLLCMISPKFTCCNGKIISMVLPHGCSNRVNLTLCKCDFLTSFIATLPIRRN